MKDIRYKNKYLDYQPIRIRSPGQPLNRQLDG